MLLDIPLTADEDEWLTRLTRAARPDDDDFMVGDMVAMMLRIVRKEFVIFLPVQDGEFDDEPPTLTYMSN
jgi:hypothetical protein